MGGLGPECREHGRSGGRLGPGACGVGAELARRAGARAPPPPPPPPAAGKGGCRERLRVTVCPNPILLETKGISSEKKPGPWPFLTVVWRELPPWSLQVGLPSLFAGFTGPSVETNQAFSLPVS